MKKITVIGGGLAGCEAAYRIAQQGIPVDLWEMRPKKMTPAHQSGNLAELVCSNSLKSDLPDSAQGLLKREMRQMGSLLLSCADQCRVPAGSALAVDRERFSELVTETIQKHPLITLYQEERVDLPKEGVAIVATGPLTSEALSREISQFTGAEQLFFYDAVAPSVTLESLDLTKIFRASRYGRGEDDYYNCPFTKEEYETFYQALLEADVAQPHDFETDHVFSGCMPIEVMARRGVDTLRYGPMRPVGLTVPETGKRAWALLQLRQENLEGTVFGLVGFQTRMKWGDQARVFRLIPGLEQAEFVRYGVMHRNTYVNAPHVLCDTLQTRLQPNLFLAGQITGVEGYMESAATGILAGENAVRFLRRQPLICLPETTMLGALLRFITTADEKHFQPMNANFGLLPPLETPIKDKKIRYQAYTERALKTFPTEWKKESGSKE